MTKGIRGFSQIIRYIVQIWLTYVLNFFNGINWNKKAFCKGQSPQLKLKVCPYSHIFFSSHTKSNPNPTKQSTPWTHKEQSSFCGEHCFNPAWHLQPVGGEVGSRKDLLILHCYLLNCYLLHCTQSHVHFCQTFGLLQWSLDLTPSDFTGVTLGASLGLIIFIVLIQKSEKQ